MDLQCFDSLVVASRHLDRDVLELTTSLSRAPVHQSSNTRPAFLEKCQTRINALRRDVELLEKDTLGKSSRGAIPSSARIPTTEELVDAAEDAVNQIRQQTMAVLEFLVQYGYTPEGEIPARKVAPTEVNDDLQNESPRTPEPPRTPIDPISRVPEAVSQEPQSPEESPASPTRPPQIQTFNTPRTARILEFPDSPIATLEDFGLSSASLDTFDGESLDGYSSMSMSFDASTRIGSRSSPEPPNQRSKKRSSRGSDSLFKNLMEPVQSEEFEFGLPKTTASQLTLGILNHRITELNERIRDKQLGLDPNTDFHDADIFSVADIMHILALDRSDAAVTASALLSLHRVVNIGKEQYRLV
ncbi:hypothetical protein HK104_000816 [Borealophlyctis nickersoniae]|nr:hypothetical protein HK104_000816 [Borealophlyctis nickersoniae]